MTEVVNPGDTTTPPVDPPADPAPVADPPNPPEPTPPGDGSDNNAGDPPNPEMVPSGRLREETERRRKAEDELEAFKKQNETPPAPVVNEDDDLEPDVEELIRKGAKKLGLVSKDDLAAERSKQQVAEDVQSLTTAPPVQGIPYDHRAVMEYAQANNLPITSKSALTAAYKELNWNKIVEGERQRAIDGYKTAGNNGAETPGSQGAQPPEEPALTGKSTKERNRERIRNARQKLNV